jgi:hypothetical protein
MVVDEEVSKTLVSRHFRSSPHISEQLTEGHQ